MPNRTDYNIGKMHNLLTWSQSESISAPHKFFDSFCGYLAQFLCQQVKRVNNKMHSNIVQALLKRNKMLKSNVHTENIVEFYANKANINIDKATGLVKLH